MNKRRRSLTIELENGLTATQKRGAWKVQGQGLGFTLLEMKPGVWRMNYESCGERQRKQFQAPNLPLAAREAVRILRPLGDDPEILTVAAVCKRWLDTRTCSEGTKADYQDAIERFIKWLGVAKWSALRLETLQRYVVELTGRKLQPRTIQIYTFPIRAVSKWAAANWPDTFSDFAASFRVPRRQGPPIERDFLSIEEVATFLLWLRTHQEGWKILPGVALQGLCGLRLSEVLRLRRENVDLDRGLIKISGEVKNGWSVRTIPIPALVLEVLRSAPMGEMLIPTYGERSGYASGIRARLSEWKPGRRIEPKGLRRSIPSAAKIEGWDGYLLERFLGHAPAGVTEKNYVGNREGTLPEHFQRQVISQVDAVLAPFVDEWRGQSGKVIRVAFGNG